MKEYIKFSKKFKENSIFSYIAPSLLSKSFEYKNNNYFNLEYKFKFNDFFPNPIKILSLFCSYFRIIIFFLKQQIKKKKIICICTRAGGIKNKSSFEDRRFSGLEKNIYKKGLSVIYYCDGVIKNKKFFYKKPVIYSEDLFSFAKFLYLIFFPITLVNYLFTSKNYPKWKYDLYINLCASIVVYFFAIFFDKVFFWDFNYYRYPLFIGSKFAGCDLIGSMHNFHPLSKLPWISGDSIAHLSIPHFFTDYESTFLIFNKENKVNNLFQTNRWKRKNKLLNIVIIQENQTNQSDLLKYLYKYRNCISNIYIKLRPDKNGSDLFIQKINSYNLKYEIINNIYDNLTKEFIFIGTASTLLLEIASTGRLALSFDKHLEKMFENPARPFAIKKKEINFNQKSNVITNPYYITELDSLEEISLFNKFLIPSNAVVNHIIFQKYKIQSLVNHILKNR